MPTDCAKDSTLVNVGNVEFAHTHCASVVVELLLKANPQLEFHVWS